MFICQVLGYNSRQAHYKAIKKEKMEAKIEAKVLELTKVARQEQHRMGSEKVHLEIIDDLKKAGCAVGRDKVRKILKKNNLDIKPKKKYTTTTDSNHRYRKYTNRIKTLNIKQPEQVFVSDITYVTVNNKHAYLFLITDAYSKKIMGWTINYTMKVIDGIKAVKMAHKNRRFNNDVFHHSDRGVQYCSPRYIKYIKKKNMIPSMTEDLHVYENAVAERINGILKQEFDIDCGFPSLIVARAVIDRVIFIYNNKRRHNSLHNLTPNFVHFNPGIKIKKWGSKKKKNQEKMKSKNEEKKAIDSQRNSTN